MTSLFTLKKQKKTDGSESSTGTENSAPAKKSRLSMAEVRINKDLTDLVLPSTCKIDFPDQNVLSNFNLTISPDDGYYKDGHFVFSFNFGRQYPYEPPKVKCLTEVYHPNIDKEGNICLNILREDWKPVLMLSSIVYGLQFLFLEPNADDPLDKEAGRMFRENKATFERYAKACVYGGYVDSKYFHGCAADDKRQPSYEHYHP